jgi:undecaprenyl pyrophosphate phosphatase UppP
MEKKITIGFVVGFIVWTVLWLGSDTLMRMLPTFTLTVDTDGNFTNIPTNYLIIKLVLSVIFSIIAGLIAATISKETTKAPLVLGVALLIVGLFFQFGEWDILPIWYHMTFLIFLLPATLFGGKLRSFREVTQ